MPRKIKLLIITEGGRNIGFGHVARCIALAQAFEKRGINSRFIIYGDVSITGLLKQSRYQLLDWRNKKDKTLKAVKGADIIIVDSYLASASFYQCLRKSQKNIVYIDDNNRMDYPGGIVINGSIYAKTLGYSKEYLNKYLLGAKFALLRKEFWKVPSKRIKDKIRSIMVTFGGEDIKNVASCTLSFLVKHYPGLIKNIVIGRGFRNVKGIVKAADKRTNLIYYPGANSMKDLMLNSDIVISSGGQTLYEFARIGVPVIAVCCAKNQLRNMAAWSKTGFIKYAGWYKDSNLMNNIAAAIRQLEPKKNRLIISAIGRNAIDGNGPRRAADFILKELF